MFQPTIRTIIVTWLITAWVSIWFWVTFLSWVAILPSFRPFHCTFFRNWFFQGIVVRKFVIAVSVTEKTQIWIKILPHIKADSICPTEKGIKSFLKENNWNHWCKTKSRNISHSIYQRPDYHVIVSREVKDLP